MNDRKTTMYEFCKYLENILETSMQQRLYRILKCNYYDDDLLEDISDYSFCIKRNVGVKVLAEFKNVKKQYRLHLESANNEIETDPNAADGVRREKFFCWLRSDIANALKTIENKSRFIESALLDKFENDEIIFSQPE